MALRIDRFALRKPAAIVGLTLVAIHLVLALFSPWISPHDPTALVGGRADPPSLEFLMGTDVLGRDVLSRLVRAAVEYGACERGQMSGQAAEPQASRSQSRTAGSISLVSLISKWCVNLPRVASVTSFQRGDWSRRRRNTLSTSGG